VFGLQWPNGKLPDITDELDPSVFCNVQYVEYHSCFHTTLRVTSIDPPSEHDPQRKPTIHFEGESLVGTMTEIHVQGAVYDEGGGVIRWSMSSSVAGEVRLLMEGVQIGGVQSAAGWAGCWTAPARGQYDPAGPTWAYKMGG